MNNIFSGGKGNENTSSEQKCMQNNYVIGDIGTLSKNTTSTFSV